MTGDDLILSPILETSNALLRELVLASLRLAKPVNLSVRLRGLQCYVEIISVVKSIGQMYLSKSKSK